MRTGKAVAAALVGLILAFLSAAPAAAHTGKLKLTVAGDGADGVTVQATYADGHRLDKVVRLVLTASGSGGRTVGPLQLEPAAEGQGFYASGPILSPGRWRVTVSAPVPHRSEATAQVDARAPQSPSLAPAATDGTAPVTAADPRSARREETAWWSPVGIAVLALAALALAAPLLFIRRRRT